MRKIWLLLLLPLQMVAQPTPFLAFKKYPFPTALTASATGARIAWAMDEEGRRNIYVAEGPAYTPRKLTDFTKDDGQEITSLTLSDDGSWVVFVRGGDHGANWENGQPVNPAFETEPFKVQVASIPFNGGPVKYLSEGDQPVVSPDGHTVAFIKNNQVWTAPADASSAAKNAFTTRGNVGSLKWSPDGRRLLFVTTRTDHSIIGIFTPGSPVLKWIAPSFSRDESPQWSNDGSRIVFVRRPGTGGAPDSLLVNKPAPWSLYIADTIGLHAALLWKAPLTLRGSYPSTDGGANLHWAAGNIIVFLSYEDGWPHLYSVDASTAVITAAPNTVAASTATPSTAAASTAAASTAAPSTAAANTSSTNLSSAANPRPLLLTPGNFMCEHIQLSPDKKYLLCSANTGATPNDLERRHVLMIPVDRSGSKIMTPGEGLEWTPVLTGDGTTLAFISATAQRPPLPAVLRLQDQGGSNFQLLGQDLIPQDFPQSRLVSPRAVTFTAPDGVVVHGDLFEPPGGKPRKPAIVYIHGGPPRQMLLGWHYSDYYSNAYASNQYLASLGFVVLAVNYRLGIGYGYDFHRPANAGPAGASEYRDIKAAGEWLRRQNFVDTGRIGVYGGSYGGFLTAMALAKDSRLFAAGVDFHGVHDWLASQSSIYSASHDRYEKAPDYEKAVKTAWLSSPVSSIATWRSPVLIIQGDDDRNVHFSESVDLIRRLEKQGVPYESLMIVDDTHHWMNFNNAVTVYSAAADFFVRKFMN
jgi:dipeptidyl aminopeptidase/acylaminoacyl peptidase